LVSALLCVSALNVLAACWQNGGGLEASRGSTTSRLLAGHWVPDSVPPSTHLKPGFQLSLADITFRRNGRWVGSNGCDDLTGSYSFDATTGKFTSTGDVAIIGGCAQNGRVLGEIPYDQVLAAATDVTFPAPGEAVFKASDGSLVLSLKRVA